MSKFLRKARNWALAAVLFIGAIADFGFGLLTEIQHELEVPPIWVTIVRIVVVACALAATKLQTPTNNPEKLEELARAIREKRSQSHNPSI